MSLKPLSGETQYHWMIIALLVFGAFLFYLVVIHILSSDNNDRISKLAREEGKSREKKSF